MPSIGGRKRTWNWPWLLLVGSLAPAEETGCGEQEIGNHDWQTELGLKDTLVTLRHALDDTVDEGTCDHGSNDGGDE